MVLEPSNASDSGSAFDPDAHPATLRLRVQFQAIQALLAEQQLSCISASRANHLQGLLLRASEACARSLAVMNGDTVAPSEAAILLKWGEVLQRAVIEVVLEHQDSVGFHMVPDGPHFHRVEPSKIWKAMDLDFTRSFLERQTLHTESALRIPDHQP